MKKRMLARVLLVTVFTLGVLGAHRCFAQGIAQGLYFGQTPPGLTPEIFAPGIISLDDRYEYSVAFSPDLTECVFGVTNNFWVAFTLLYTTMASDSSWSDPVTGPFLGTGDGLNPVYFPDGESIFFASSRPSYPPANLWKAVRDGAGWADPVMVPDPVSTSADEFAPSFSATGVMYFVSYRAGGIGDGDIYRSVPVGGVYTSVDNVGAPISSTNLDSTPFIAPDESYILFESNRPGGFGQHDLYISYQLNGVWSTPENLGSEINTNQIEDEPYVSPDGRYLFFNRRAAFVTPQQTDLYWVDIAAIPDPTSVTENGLGGGSGGLALGQNFPNPFDPSTEITYTLSAPGFVSIQVFDVRGRKVESLVDRHQDAGTHSVTLAASRTGGMVSGPYFYRLLVDGEAVTTKKMTLVR